MPTPARARLVNSITGRFSHNQWTDKDTGDNRERYEVIANLIGYLDAPAKDQPTDVKPGEEPF